MPRGPTDRTLREFIYVIEVEGAGVVKLGRTRNVQRRLAELQNANHQQLRIVALLRPDLDNGGPTLERVLLASFPEDWIRGEWYRLSAALKAFIAQHRLKTINEILDGPETE